MLVQNHQLHCSYSLFMKAISLFNMQGLKVNNNRRTIRGPNKVDMRVVNQGRS